MPRASPDTTVRPARANPRAICSANFLPYPVQARDPTMAIAPASASVHSPRKYSNPGGFTSPATDGG